MSCFLIYFVADLIVLQNAAFLIVISALTFGRLCTTGTHHNTLNEQKDFIGSAKITYDPIVYTAVHKWRQKQIMSNEH